MNDFISCLEDLQLSSWTNLGIISSDPWLSDNLSPQHERSTIMEPIFPVFQVPKHGKSQQNEPLLVDNRRILPLPRSGRGVAQQYTRVASVVSRGLTSESQTGKRRRVDEEAGEVRARKMQRLDLAPEQNCPSKLEMDLDQSPPVDLFNCTEYALLSTQPTPSVFLKRGQKDKTFKLGFQRALPLSRTRREIAQTLVEDSMDTKFSTSIITLFSQL